MALLGRSIYIFFMFQKMHQELEQPGFKSCINRIGTHSSPFGPFFKQIAIHRRYKTKLAMIKTYFFCTFICYEQRYGTFGDTDLYNFLCFKSCINRIVTIQQAIGTFLQANCHPQTIKKIEISTTYFCILLFVMNRGMALLVRPNIFCYASKRIGTFGPFFK